MNLTRSLTAALAAAALTPASALADAPWTTPATVPGAVGYRAQIVFTKTGHASLVADAPGSRTLVTPVSDDGRPGTPRTLSLSSALLTAYGDGAIALAGTRTVTTAAQARTATIAVGAKGDVLVVWEDNHTIYSRHRGPGGRWAAAQKLGAGVQSSLQAVFADSGRQEVAWMSQRVSEGDGGNATISYTSAARGHGFSRPVVVGTDAPTGTGRYVATPGVRLVASGTDSSVLALTVYDGAHFRTAVADVAGGGVQPLQMVSPEGEDDVLADLAYARAGGTLVLSRSGTAGHDPNGPQRLFATVRPSGTLAFGAPELVSDPAETVPETAYGAVDPRTGVALAGFGYLSPQVVVSARPARQLEVRRRRTR